MTKEEYLNMYKEDKLAEICEQLEEKCMTLKEKCAELDQEKGYYYDAMSRVQQLCNELSEYWKSIDNLFERLQTLSAKDFIKLYYMMQSMMNNHERYDNTYVPQPNNWDKIITTISSR